MAHGQGLPEVAGVGRDLAGSDRAAIVADGLAACHMGSRA